MVVGNKLLYLRVQGFSLNNFCLCPPWPKGFSKLRMNFTFSVNSSKGTIRVTKPKVHWEKLIWIFVLKTMLSKAKIPWQFLNFHAKNNENWILSAKLYSNPNIQSMRKLRVNCMYCKCQCTVSTEIYFRHNFWQVQLYLKVKTKKESFG